MAPDLVGTAPGRVVAGLPERSPRSSRQDLGAYLMTGASPGSRRKRDGSTCALERSSGLSSRSARRQRPRSPRREPQ